VLLKTDERYRVLERLGEGAMGAVYLVEDAGSGERRAMKVLLPGTEPDEAAKLRFKQEYRVMARLRHPNLCEVYDYGTLPDGAPYFTMEFVPGRPLDELVGAPQEELLPLVGQLCAALGYVHQHGLVHCDLKPENVRIRPDGVAKLMDFGLMEPAGQALGAIQGSLSYLSPEMAKRDRVDQRADLYSLGVMLYELLSGSLPIKGNTPLELLRAHLTEAPRPLREVMATVQRNLAEVVMALLAKEPAARPQSAREVQAALGLAQDGDDNPTLLGSPFVGRKAELAVLGAALGQAARDGKGQLIQLRGEAGMGKTRLLGELRCQAQLEEVPYYEGQGQGADVPYGPWVGILRQLLPTIRRNCPEDLAAEAPWLGKLLPEIAPAQAPDPVEPDQERLLIQAAIARLVDRATQRVGAVVVLEHWENADALSIQMLAAFQRSVALASRPLLLVVSGRDLADDPSATHLQLHGLTRDEVHAMVAGMLGQEKVPTSLSAQLQEVLAGNPRAIEDALDNAARAGRFGRDGLYWRLPEKLAPEDLTTDPGQFLAKRLAGLDGQGLAVAWAAAVLGVGFDLASIAAIAGQGEDVVFDALEALVRAKLLDVLEGQYRWAQPDLRELLASQIPAEEARRLHAAAADRLDGQLAGHAVPPLELLYAAARHRLATEDAERAIPLALAAARRYQELFSFETADDLIAKGYALMEREPERWRTERCDYLDLMVFEARRNFKVEASDRLVAEQLRLAEELGDPRRVVAALVNKSLVAALHFTNGTGNKAEQMATLQRTADAARAAGERVALLRANSEIGRTHLFAGEFDKAREVLEAALKETPPSCHPSMHARAASLFHYAVAQQRSTREEGLQHLGEVVELQRKLGDKIGERYTRNLLADLQLEGGRFKEALETCEGHVRLSRELQGTEDYIVGLVNLAHVYVQLGCLDQARQIEQEFQGVVRDLSGTLPTASYMKGNLALVEILKGNLAEGCRLLREAEAAARAAGSYWFKAILPMILEGWILAGRLDTAISTAQEAVFAIRGEGDTRAEMVVAIGLAEGYALQGRWDQAAEHAEKAYEAALAQDARGVLLRAMRLKANVALGRGEHEEALAWAEKGQRLAGQTHMRVQAALLVGLHGEIAMAAGRKDAAVHFQTMQAMADEIGAPLVRARALFGQARAGQSVVLASGLLTEAQRTVRQAVEPLEGAEREEVLAFPIHKAILSQNPNQRTSNGSVLEGSLQMGDRFHRVGEEIQALAGQYEHMFQEWQVSNTQLRRLNELTAKMGESLRIDEVLGQVVALTLEITKAERGFVVLKGTGRYEDLVCRAAVNSLGQALSPTAFSLAICQKVLAAGQAIAILDASSDTDFQASRSVVALNIQTVMGVPLMAKGKTLGVLYVDSQAIVTTFTEKDLELLRAIAGHASIAIENAMLYEDLNKRAEELESALALYRQAERDANSDLLTGLANRRAFFTAAAREMGVAKRLERPLCVIMMDVDHFKKFNDTYGHAIGDEVLKAMGRLLPASVRPSDMPARLGGEEFVVLCPDSTPEATAEVAERIRQAVSEVKLTDADGNPVRQITASLGIARLTADDEKIDEALERADIALYECKRNGRNQVQVWHPEMLPPH
jgi:diguanylate cyclase (GGDEF)-like protein